MNNVNNLPAIVYTRRIFDVAIAFVITRLEAFWRVRKRNSANIKIYCIIFWLILFTFLFWCQRQEWMNEVDGNKYVTQLLRDAKRMKLIPQKTNKLSISFAPDRAKYTNMWSHYSIRDARRLFRCSSDDIRCCLTRAISVEKKWKPHGISIDEEIGFFSEIKQL